MGFAVRRQICCCFGDLYSVNIGLHLELLHQFASLSDASCVVGGHEAGGSGRLHWNADGTADSGNLIFDSFCLLPVLLIFRSELTSCGASSASAASSVRAFPSAFGLVLQ